MKVSITTTEHHRSTPKKTSIGHSVNTRLKSKNDKRTKKLYRGQGS